ncbi:alpha 1,2 mannosyltransferase [Coemansia sp. RSA 990]|nr:Alg9-like mannosyltransferase family-domain-containing protein [Coemansia mojavensis]KAJ1748860.1 alpha 1,2 mannosyltransferase [Coemansia sp. RSA 1821]KAJ1870839.1 alpha 1,2 mannosyltransferase [Coemansia sp. RSA 990]
MRYRKLWYIILLAARILAAVSPAYIHPDEYFQGPEIAAGDIFQIDALRTWEFTPTSPVRSIVPIYLFTGTPLVVLKLLTALCAQLGWSIPVTGKQMFYANRLFMVLATLLIDICVVRAISRLYPKAQLQATRLLLASSSCLIVFHTHTFANSFASITLAICFDLLSAIEAKTQTAACKLACVSWWLGVALALGTFTHVSFPMFALPVGLIALLLLARAKSYKGAVCLAAGGLLAAIAIVIADSVYFQTAKFVNGKVSGTLTLTVLNNVLYNSDRGNLATHGIHPWYNHLVVSTPVLFGPLAVLAIARLWSFIKTLRSQTDVKCTLIAAGLSAGSGLVLLSMVPHQEPRFLVPMMAPLVICTWRFHRVVPAYFWKLWVLFNAAIFVGYGVLHQAGVTPAVDFVSQTSVLPRITCHFGTGNDHIECMAANGNYTEHRLQVTSKVFAFAAFMAPRHLLAQPTHSEWQAQAEIHDLISVEDSSVQEKLSQSVHVSCKQAQTAASGSILAKQTTSGHFERTLLVVPSSLDIRRIVPADSNYSVVELYSYAPHVNFDHIGEILLHPIQRTKLRVLVICDPSR